MPRWGPSLFFGSKVGSKFVWKIGIGEAADWKTQEEYLVSYNAEADCEIKKKRKHAKAKAKSKKQNPSSLKAAADPCAKMPAKAMMKI